MQCDALLNGGLSSSTAPITKPKFTPLKERDELGFGANYYLAVPVLWNFGLDCVEFIISVYKD